MARCPSQNCAVVLNHLLKHSQCFKPGFSTCVARTYARCRASGRVDSGHVARVNLGLLVGAACIGWRGAGRTVLWRPANLPTNPAATAGSPPKFHINLPGPGHSLAPPPSQVIGGGGVPK